MAMKQDIEIHIDELVLHGFQPGDFASIRDAVEMELRRLLTYRGVPVTLSSSTRHAAINVGQFNAVPGGHAATLGSQIASTVYNGLENNKSPVKK